MAYTRLIALASALLIFATAPALAARCGNNAAGFEKWKRSFAQEAKANGIGPRGINALMGTRYAYGTIKADRSQHSFKLSPQIWPVPSQPLSSSALPSRGGVYSPSCSGAPSPNTPQPQLQPSI